MPIRLPDTEHGNGLDQAGSHTRGDQVLSIDMAAGLQAFKGAGGGRRKKDYEQLNRWFEIALNNMARGLSMFDPDQRLVFCNKLYREIFDLPELLTQPGTAFAEIVRYHVKRETGQDDPEAHENQRAWIEAHVAELARGKTFSSTRQLKDGRTILVSNQPLPDGGWVDLQEDVTERRQAEHQISWLARHDTLTELANRLYFREHLETMLQDLAAGGGFAIHWMDLDRFKEVNDTLGHPTGDALLKSVAKRLRGVLRSSDFVARLGGDEFVIIQADVADDETARLLATRLIKAVSQPHHVLGHNVSVGASVGVVRVPDHGTDANELLKAADIALYQAKSSGRGISRLFQPSGEAQPGQRRHLEADLPFALENGELELHYQPILDLKSKEVGSFEALLRWRHPKHGLVPPSDFICIAEETGAIVDIGAWVLKEACRQATEWPDQIRVTVNVSAIQFEQGDLVQAVTDALEAAGLAPGRLELEITEGLLLRDEARTHETLYRLKGHGVSIALDDFGTAYASLSYLRSFPFDKIKIDRSFIRDLDQPARNDCVAIINAVAGLARQLNMTTVAEGIETLDHVNTVLVAGCDEVQGYYFSKPVPAAEIPSILAQTRPRTAAA